jgi:AraC-like DNA-binding protein
MPFNSIHKFSEINEFHHAARGGVQTKWDDVHVFRLRDLSSDVVKEMPLFRMTYYQIGLMRKCDFSMSVYEKTYNSNQNFALVFFKPGQLIQFKTDPDWDGYVIHFKTELLGISNENADAVKRFSALDPTRESFVILKESDFILLADLYERMLQEYDKSIRDSISVIQLYLQILFYKINEVYARSPLTGAFSSSKKENISFGFKKLVAEKLRETKTIRDYADMLNVTPKYLIEAVNYSDGLSPKDYLDQRLVEEVKTILKFTEKSIYDVSRAYQFRDQAHFSRFFKLHTGLSPLEYRKQFADMGKFDK